MPPDSSSSGSRNAGGRHSLIILREKFLDTLVERFSAAKHERRNRFLLLLTTGLLLTFFIIPTQQFLNRSYKVGEVAGSDVRATQDYLLEDGRLTQIKRSEAEAATPYVYTLNPEAAQELIKSFEHGL